MANTMIAEGNGIQVAINHVGDIITSADNGVTWSDSISPFKSADALWTYVGIVFGGGHFLAYGSSIVIIGTGLPATEWMSTLTTGNWVNATFDGSNWFLTDLLGRTIMSKTSYPAEWVKPRL